MYLSQLLSWLPDAQLPPALPARPVRSVVQRAQSVRPGDVFVAIRGARYDGHDFAREATERGALAVVAERPCDGAPCVLVTNSRLAFARLCAVQAGEPTRRLAVTAITGTNGKTTTAYLLEHCLRTAGRVTGLIGTVEVRYPGVCHPSSMTTPDADFLQATFAAMAAAGVTECVLEASSHGLAAHRLDGSHLDAAVFTNLQRDHLDHHGTLDAYFAAKRRLFSLLAASAKEAKVAVVNADDPWGMRILSELDGRRLSFGLGPGADVRGRWRREGRGSLVDVLTPWGSFTAFLPMGGRHNVQNALAATAAALARGVPLDAIAAALVSAPSVPGRRQELPLGMDFHVYVDFAHNPAGLAALLEDLRQAHPFAKLRLVFGCKGRDGDRDKRRAMGAVAAAGADWLVLTTDDPYEEDPASIAATVLEGIPPSFPATVVLDRRQAIQVALRAAQQGDVVVVAGRGPEAMQFGPDGLVPFHDPDVVAEEASRLGSRLLAPTP